MYAPRLTFDTDRKRVVMFSGAHDMEISGRLYELDGGRWAPICTTTGGPPPRFLPAFAYDAGRKAVVVAGGRNRRDGGMVLDDAWECDVGANTWTQLAPLPQKRVGGQMVFDKARHALVLVGGYNGSQMVKSFLELDRAAAMWRPTSFPVDGPEGIGGTGTAAVYNGNHQSILVLVDHSDEDSGGHDELWELRDEAWHLICGPCGATPRTAASIAHLPRVDETYLINGYDDTGNEVAGASVLERESWVKAFEDPPARDSSGVVYDPSRDAIVVAGGNGDSCDGDCETVYELVPAPR
jgi:hypothetical protein